MNRLFFILIFLFFYICNVEAQGTGGRFPIVAWGSIPQEFTGDAQYRQLSAAGANISFSHFTSLNNALKALDIAAKNNIKILLYCPELFSKTEWTVRQVKDHPGLGGYLLSDEPNIQRFDAIKKWIDIIKRIDNKNICYVNLYPNSATRKQLGGVSYTTYLEKFYSMFDLKMYSFDNYPIRKGVVNKNWYQNLELVASMTRNKGASFWGFVRIISVNDPSEVISLADLKLQTFANLAYGAQGIQFYRYWTLQDKKFANGPMSVRGTKNSNYSKLQQVTSYINNLKSIFMGAHLVQSLHTEQGSGVKKFAKNSMSALTLSNSKNLLITRLQNGRNNYIVFVNKDIRNTNSFTVYPKQNATFIDKDLKRQNVLTGKAFKAVVQPGDILIMKYN